MTESFRPRAAMLKTKQLSEEQSVLVKYKDLEKLLQHGQALENDFEEFIKVNSRTKSRYGGKGCDQKSATDVQSNSSMFDLLFFWRAFLFFWRRRDLLFFWKRRQTTKSDNDEITLKKLEQSFRSKLQDNTKLIQSCQKGFDGLPQQSDFVGLTCHEKQQIDLPKDASELNETSGGRSITTALSSLLKIFSVGEKRQVTFQLYCQQQADVVPSIMTNLIEELRAHLSKNSIELKEKIVKSASDIAIDLPLIVICLHAFRLGPDVSGAIRGIQSGPNVAVLIVHHKDIFTLPSESSNQILLGKDYSEIGAIIDIGFMEGKGIYQCGMNLNAIKELANFIIDNNKP